jgi:predicted short-subunit dehydrogenase-like oxidoreductase (DUF2520 family)
MTFSIIGTGNIAWFFGQRLVTGRHNCTGVYSRNPEAAKELAGALMAQKHGVLADIADEDADVCFLAVSDAAIPQVAAPLSFSNTMLLHTAGAVGLDSIQNAAKDCAVLWPVYSILKNNLPDHRNIPCAWEASTKKAEAYVQSLGNAITDVLFEAKYEQRKWLHLSAVISNNFINHLMAICEQVCAENNLPFSTLLPIIEQTFDRIKHASPQNLQTGPAIRKDSNTIEGQVALLAGHPQWQAVYEAITASIQTPNQ